MVLDEVQDAVFDEASLARLMSICITFVTKVVVPWGYYAATEYTIIPYFLVTATKRPFSL